MGIDKLFTIGKLAREAGVNLQTIRYYERYGILNPSSKTGAGYRLYGDGEIRRLQFIQHAKKLGFTLNEIGELLELRVTSKSSCESIRKKAEDKLKIVEERMKAMDAIKSILEELIIACKARRTAEECPILESIEKGGEYHVSKKKG